jgi:micrococcal nuclease
MRAGPASPDDAGHPVNPAGFRLSSISRVPVGFFLLALIGLLFRDAALYAADRATVKRVNDGDTVQLTDGRSVRYIGVNAPEIDHARNAAQPLGFEARALNARLVEGRMVRLELDAERRDDYRRALAYVFLPDGTMVNERLLQAGVAFCLYRRPNVKYEFRLLAAQRAAMQAGRGLWRNWREGEGRYIGNRNSRRFHLSGCPEAKRISRANRVMFSKRWDAFWDGYSPSRECLPDFFSHPD